MNLLDLDAPDLWLLVLGRNEPGGAMARPARASMCPSCGAHRIHGLDADWAALPAKVDPRPLTALGEALAIVSGLRTYDLGRYGSGYQLDYRDQGHVQSRPAGSGRSDVLAEHRCHLTLDHGPPVLRRRSVTTDPTPPF